MLADRVLGFIREHKMVEEGDLLLVGVSGGADSLCLAHVLLTIKDLLGIRLHVAHLDHSLRPESSADASFVADMAARWGMPCTVERQDVRRFRARHRLTLEEAARRVRYIFFGRLSRELGAAGVAVGHTVDDQVETILLHWIRGTGLAGMRGMQPVTRFRVSGLDEEVRVLRPALQLKRTETESYCAVEGIQPRQDASNLSLKYRRNRVRHRLLPTLESYNPNIRETLLRMARIAERDYGFIESEVNRVWPEVASEGPAGVTITTASAMVLPPAVLYQLLRHAVERAAGSTAGLELVHLDEMVAALGKPSGTILNLPNGLILAVGYGYCTISLGRTPPPFPPIRRVNVLTVPGETHLPGWKVIARVQDSGPWNVEQDPWSATLDLDKLGDRLWVRPRRSGDRFQPLGMEKEKRLQDFFVDAKVPRSWRDAVPLVVTPAQIAWIAGWRIDDRVKVTEATRRVLHLRFIQAPDAGG